MAKKIKNENIEYGDVSLSSEDLDFSKGKIRITTMIDRSVYDALKSDAKVSGKKYQTILNEILMNHYFAPKVEVRIGEQDRFMNELGRIKKRLAALEKERTA